MRFPSQKQGFIKCQEKIIFRLIIFLNNYFFYWFQLKLQTQMYVFLSRR